MRPPLKRPARATDEANRGEGSQRIGTGPRMRKPALLPDSRTAAIVRYPGWRKTKEPRNVANRGRGRNTETDRDRRLTKAERKEQARVEREVIQRRMAA